MIRHPSLPIIITISIKEVWLPNKRRKTSLVTFQNDRQTVHAPGADRPQLKILNHKREKRLWSLFKMTGGPSAVQSQNPPETQNVSGHFVKWPADHPRPMSAVQAISTTRKNTSLDKFNLSRRTVRPSGPDRLPFNAFLTKDKNMSLDIFTIVWRTVRPSRPDRPPLNS